MGLLSELRRRNVIRMAGLYLVGAWLIVQVAETVLPAFDIPGWVLRAIIIVLALGFLPALVFAWIFELTPEGLKRDKDVAPDASIATQTGRRMDRLLLVGMVLVVALVAADRWWPRQETGETGSGSLSPSVSAVPGFRAGESEPDPVSPVSANAIAVLPFVDMSQDKDQEYFSDGLSEELLNLLAQLPQLKVIARTSSFSFKGKDADVATIAKALDVAYVLEGSVRKSGNTLRVTAQLIRAADSTHLWSQTFDRELTDVFAVQDEIAIAVVDALKVKLLPEQAMVNYARSDNPEAYNEYLLGRELQNRQSPDAWAQAMTAFRRAISLDARYAAAYAGLSNAGTQLADHSGDAEGKAQAIRDAEQAIALAPRLADGYFARAMANLSFTQDWRAAQADLEHALSLGDSNSDVLLGQARFLCSQARIADALLPSRRATEIDPLKTLAWALYGRVLAAHGDLAQSRQAMHRAVELSPTSNFALFHLGNSYLLDGQAEQALDWYERTRTGYGLVGKSMAHHSLGHASESQAALDTAIDVAAHTSAYQIAEAYAWRGETDKAFEWLDRAFAQNDGGVGFIRADPLLANIVDDPRYNVLLKKHGLME